MVEIVDVIIGNDETVKYCSPSKYDLKVGTNIVIRTENGLQYAKVVRSNYHRKANEIKGMLYKVSRIASKEDYQKNKKNIELEKKAFEKCKNLIKKYELNMSLISVSYTFNHSLLLFQFISDERVDFRSLAKELASIYKTRIELRQVGVRDKAKIIGGCGQCGKELCCRQFLKDFESVSINNVKNQNLSLNPNKINGVCGRLLCCLKYEDDVYSEYRKTLPTVGKMVKTDQGEGKVISIDILKQTYRVELDNNQVIECSVDGSN